MIDLRELGRALRLSLTHALSGARFGVGCVVVAVSVFLALVIDTSGFSPGWFDPVNTVLSITGYVGPLLLGAAVSDVQIFSRSGLFAVARTTPRGDLGGVLVCVTSWLIWGAASLVLSCLILCAGRVRTWPDVGALALAGLAVTVVVTSVVVGAGLGYRFRSRLLAPLAAIGAFAWIYGVSYSTDWWVRLSPIDPVTRYRVFLEPNAAALVWQIVVGVGLSLLGVALLLRRGAAVGAVVSGVVFLALGVAPLTSSPSMTQARALEGQPSCVTSPASVCVWPEHESALDSLAVAAGEVVQRSDGLVGASLRWEEVGLDGTSTEPGEGRFVVSDDGDEASYVAAVVEAAVPVPSCVSGEAETAPAWNSYFRVRGWLVDQVLDGAGTPGDRISATPDRGPVTDSRTWLSDQLERIDRCAPS